MKGIPAVPGGPLTSKPTWFSTPWVPDHVGFFLFVPTNVVRTNGVRSNEDDKQD